jgi:hypothetical protein
MPDPMGLVVLQLTLQLRPQDVPLLPQLKLQLRLQDVLPPPSSPLLLPQAEKELYHKAARARAKEICFCSSTYFPTSLLQRTA